MTIFTALVVAALGAGAAVDFHHARAAVADDRPWDALVRVLFAGAFAGLAIFGAQAARLVYLEHVMYVLGGVELARTFGVAVARTGDDAPS